MAPEVGLGQRTTVRLEVYSLGSSLYQLLGCDWLNPAINSLPTRNDVPNAVAHHTPTPSQTSHPHPALAAQYCDQGRQPKPGEP
jgi:hypothetical protein